MTLLSRGGGSCAAAAQTAGESAAALQGFGGAELRWGVTRRSVSIGHWNLERHITSGRDVTSASTGRDVTSGKERGWCGHGEVCMAAVRVGCTAADKLVNPVVLLQAFMKQRGLGMKDTLSNEGCEKYIADTTRAANSSRRNQSYRFRITFGSGENQLGIPIPPFHQRKRSDTPLLIKSSIRIVIVSCHNALMYSYA